MWHAVAAIPCADVLSNDRLNVTYHSTVTSTTYATLFHHPGASPRWWMGVHPTRTMYGQQEAGKPATTCHVTALSPGYQSCTRPSYRAVVDHHNEYNSCVFHSRWSFYYEQPGGAFGHSQRYMPVYRHAVCNTIMPQREMNGGDPQRNYELRIILCSYSPYLHQHCDCDLLHLWQLTLLNTTNHWRYLCTSNASINIPNPLTSGAGKYCKTDWRKIYLRASLY